MLRAIGRRTTAANIRNWCLVRARELDGLLDLEPVVWSRCIEPSPCQNHGDCDFPNGVCLTNFDYPEVPSAKVCHCL